MPLYEYRCLNCKKKFEIYATISEYDKLKVSCPACQSENIQRIFSRINIKTESKTEEFGDLEDFGE